MRLIWKLLLFLLAVIIALTAVTILRNGVPIAAEPGWWTRLIVYLTRNEAQTDAQSAFPELRPKHYQVDADELFNAVRAAVVELGWQIEQINPADRKLSAVVTTPLLGFKDDVSAHVESKGRKESVLHMRSASRVGRADFGANLAHLIALSDATTRTETSPRD